MTNMCSCLIADWDHKCPAHGTDSKMMKEWAKEVAEDKVRNLAYKPESSRT